MAKKKEEEKSPLIIDDAFGCWAFGNAWNLYLDDELGLLELFDYWELFHPSVQLDHNQGIFANLMFMRKLYDDTHKEDFVDKKMHQVSETIEKASKQVKKGKSKVAVKTLKKAEEKNEKLEKYDKNVRDPLIKKCKKTMR